MEASADVAASDAIAASDVSADAGAISCGTETCGGGQVCVRPCCGGAAPVCLERNDAGLCPEGTSLGPCSAGGAMQMGCRVTCTPPPPFCAPIPASGCNGTNCSVCPSMNGRRDGNEISCLCA